MFMGVRKSRFPAFLSFFSYFFKTEGDNTPTMEEYTRKRVNKAVKKTAVFAFFILFS